ncbi:class I SAM-dependent methyltransferase [Segatella paludivivens]|uniref:class I SAM-dependent methyltransferase n=2 Tax=Segatella paludivivens TaxID=185294 RepID=UPI000362C22D|nr:class I SAM-dependent methyltransferase [Segatella paludivivens]
MIDKIKESYRQSINFYDDMLTQKKWWSRLYMRLFWGNVDEKEIVKHVLDYIPSGFCGKLLDVPVGTGIFTYMKYQELKDAEIICLDYSKDMLAQADQRFNATGLENVRTLQGDVSILPFENSEFDVVLSMNGVHAFPYKEKAYSEIYRTLKIGGDFIACFYVKGKSLISDGLVNTILSRKGWFTPPFETAESLRNRLDRNYDVLDYHIEGSMAYFKARKK